MQFSTLELPERLLQALEKVGYETPTPIQMQTIPLILNGNDVLAQAQTGTGKTAAFALPALKFWSETTSKSNQDVHTLVLAPTRELAIQVAASFKRYAQCLKPQPVVQTIIGGESIESQIFALQRGVDVVVATPGRLLDLQNQQHIQLNHMALLVLDEADKLLSSGFADELNSLLQVLPTQRQTLVFSATFPDKVLSLGEKVLIEPINIFQEQSEPTLEKLKQHAIQVDHNSRGLLLRHLLKTEHWEKTVVFVASKRGAANLASKLKKINIRAVAFHGDLDQAERVAAIKAFKNKRAQVLIATDIASRGLDFEEVSHVINFDLPRSPADYIHRIGRTARAGRAGIAISFVSADSAPHFRLIEKRTGIRLERQQITGFEPKEKEKLGKGKAPIKGKRKSKKDKLREAAEKMINNSIEKL